MIFGKPNFNSFWAIFRWLLVWGGVLIFTLYALNYSLYHFPHDRSLAAFFKITKLCNLSPIIYYDVFRCVHYLIRTRNFYL